MKILVQLFNCVILNIKKNFFNKEKNDFSHDCEDVLGRFAKCDSENEKIEAEEYLNTYTTTTRWQTI